MDTLRPAKEVNWLICFTYYEDSENCRQSKDKEKLFEGHQENLKLLIFYLFLLNALNSKLAK